MSAALPVAAGGELLVGAFDSSLLIGFTALFCCALAGGAAFGDPADFVSAGALFGVVPGLVAVWAGVLVFTVGVLLLGFRISAFLLPLAFFRLAGREQWRVALPIAAGTYVTFVIVFAMGLNIPFPNGMLADWLGLQSPDSYLLGVLYHFA